MKTLIPTLLIVFLLTCFGFLPKSDAVSPPPDGGYPGGNTAEGQSALLSLTTGTYNTGIGIYSLLSLTNGSFCTGVGAGTLLANAANENTATGAGALFSNTIGTANTADGAFALFSNADGALNTAVGDRALLNNNGDENTAIGANALLSNTATGNTAIGSKALLNNTTGGTLENVQGIDVGPNIAVGWQALENNTLASANTAIGYQALRSFTTGPTSVEQLGLCTAVGFQALANATGGFSNSGFGYQALFNNTDGVFNTAAGAQALFTNTEGIANTAVGVTALRLNTTGSDNTAIGLSALEANVDGSFNTAVGEEALDANITGDINTAIGTCALFNSTGSNNTALGNQAGFNVTTASNVICIGAEGADVDNSCFIGNIVGSTVANANFVLIDTATGQLGTNPSSKRFKKDIGPMDKTSEAIFSLKPVTFHYKDDTTSTSQFGLIAEEVAKVNPALITVDKEGKPYSVRYDKVDALLLNEFLKEHKKVEELEATVAQQRKDFQAAMAKLEETITAELKGQAAQVQKVTAQLEINKPAPQIVANQR
jgi:trimeric autotransporter adhesin